MPVALSWIACQSCQRYHFVGLRCLPESLQLVAAASFSCFWYGGGQLPTDYPYLTLEADQMALQIAQQSWRDRCLTQTLEIP